MTMETPHTWCLIYGCSSLSCTWIQGTAAQRGIIQPDCVPEGWEFAISNTGHNTRPMSGDIPPKYGLRWYNTSILRSWNSHWLFPLILNPARNHGSVEDLHTSETILGGVFDIRGWDYKILKHWDAAKSTDNGPRRKSTCTIIYCNHLQSNNLCDHPQRWLGPEASTQRVQLKAMLVIGSTGLVSCGASLEVLKLNHYEDCHLKHGFLQPHMGECETAIACKSGYTVQVQSH